jgi:hypothetical protein
MIGINEDGTGDGYNCKFPSFRPLQHQSAPEISVIESNHVQGINARYSSSIYTFSTL